MRETSLPLRSGHPRADIPVTGPVFRFILFPALIISEERVSSRKESVPKYNMFVLSLHLGREVVIQARGSKNNLELRPRAQENLGEMQSARLA